MASRAEEEITVQVGRALANARLDAAKFASDIKAELEQKVTDLQGEIDALSPEVSADAGVMRLLQPSDPSSGNDLDRKSVV